jgi:hypothetical protein
MAVLRVWWNTTLQSTPIKRRRQSMGDDANAIDLCHDPETEGTINYRSPQLYRFVTFFVAQMMRLHAPALHERRRRMVSSDDEDTVTPVRRRTLRSGQLQPPSKAATNLVQMLSQQALHADRDDLGVNLAALLNCSTPPCKTHTHCIHRIYLTGWGKYIWVVWRQCLAGARVGLTSTAA